MSTVSRQTWLQIAGCAVCAVYFHVLMEWLFFVTKPSFFGAYHWPDKLFALAIAPLWPAFACIAVIGALYAAAKASGRAERACLALALGVPSAVLAVSFLILTDNFTITVFRFGIVHSGGAARLLHLVFLVFLFSASYHWIGRLKDRFQTTFLAAVTGWVTVMCLLAFMRYGQAREAQVYDFTVGAASWRPNIVLITGDGINASNTSVYGYRRDTTPFLRFFSREAAVFKRCFSNAGYTASSIGSLLTGALPTRSHFIHRTDILKGTYAYRHLPGVLRKLGYRTAQFGYRHYVDAWDVNMRNAFDEVNSRSLAEFNAFLPAHVANRFPVETFFLSQMSDRALSDVLHVAFLKKKEDHYKRVIQGGPDDPERIRSVKRFIGSAPEPFFIHLHTLGTHGPRFYPPERVFSAGAEQNERFMRDFYDDAILAFDAQVKEVLTLLKKKRLLSNTVVVIGSDHGMQHITYLPVPLIVYFPKRPQGIRTDINVQNADIAPTLLDYIGIETPEWMDGQSLLKPFNAERPLFSFLTEGKQQFAPGVKTRNARPFDGLRMVVLAQCDESFVLSLTNGKIRKFKQKRLGETCREPLTPPAAKNLIYRHLESAGIRPGDTVSDERRRP